MKIIGYVRVSTTDQSDNGVSLEAQEAKVRAYADLNGCEKIVLFSDPGISGKDIKHREGLQAAIKAIEKGDALVVYSLSRLSRSTKDTIEIAEVLDKRGADLVSISEKIDTTTAAGKMVFRMLAVLSEFERDMVTERTKMAMSYKKAKGERVGGIPHGLALMDDCKTFAPVPQEMGVIKASFMMRLTSTGLMS
jgi:DNA invertase Pin-like site-specific DNA recombinase